MPHPSFTLQHIVAVADKLNCRPDLHCESLAEWEGRPLSFDVASDPGSAYPTTITLIEPTPVTS
eukprot:2130788-Amphidinium_carterae.1